MQNTIVKAVAALVASVAALPASVDHVVVEKRTEPSNWAPLADVKLDKRTILPVKIGLKERNIDMGDRLLMKIADPASETYGKHMSLEQRCLPPEEPSTKVVRQWLLSSGIDESRIQPSRGKNWLNFNASICELENLLKTEYKIYSHKTSGQGHVACEQYSVPQEVSPYIDLIIPTVHFDTKIATDPAKQQRKRDEPRAKRSPFQLPSFPRLPDRLLPGLPTSPWLPKKGPTVQPDASNPGSTGLSNCNSQITPNCLRAPYNLPNGTLQKSSFGVVEYTPQAYLQSDMNMFYHNLAQQIPNNTAPNLDSIDGGVLQTTDQSFDYNGESSLDLQYAMALVYPQKVIVYQVGDQVEGASFNNFLDALDSSYCTSEGGDDQNYDGVYPDPYGPSGKNQPYLKHDCGKFTAATVISTSYGSNEADLTPTYMKLGMAGTTVIYSSGDYGVAGNGGQCCTHASCAGGSYNNGNSGTFNPSFPGTCPYVTSVRATQIASGSSVTAPEQACQNVIFSGGGFSNVFAMPSYQSSVVRNYFSKYKPKYAATQYNSSQAVRGYPDVSVNGANYVVAVDGSLTLIYGTSASAPTFGSIITLINEQRANAGKKSVGFINPTLYSNSSMMNDITAGGNQGCGTAGLSAVPGWDPLTGLGTPNYQKMLSVFMALP